MSLDKIKITIPQEPFNQLDAWAKKLGYKDIVDFVKKEGQLGHVKEIQHEDGLLELKILYGPEDLKLFQSC